MITIRVTGPQGSGKSNMIGWIIDLIEGEKLTWKLIQEERADVSSNNPGKKADFVIIEKQGD